jgi:putative ABC transport system permease protein
MTRRLNRGVPLARRVLFAERRRAALSVAGVAAALLLVLLLDGIFAGAMAANTYYVRTGPADVVVSQRGVRTMHMSTSVLPTGTLETARAIPGVQWAAPISLTTGIVANGTGRQLSYVIGYDTSSGRGGPRQMVIGHAPALGEALLDRIAADQIGVTVGDTVQVLGTPLRVSGITTGGTSIVNTTTFVSRDEFARLRGTTTAYVLAKASLGTSADRLAQRLRAALPGVTVQTRSQFVASEARITRDMSADLLRIMTLLSFGIALAVTALTLLTVTLTRLRDYAVVKALGSSSLRLVRTVGAQAAWTIAAAVAVAVAGAELISLLLAQVLPTVQVLVTAGSVSRTAVWAAVVGVLAALGPLPRLARVDPATAFREAA